MIRKIVTLAALLVTSPLAARSINVTVGGPQAQDSSFYPTLPNPYGSYYQAGHWQTQSTFGENLNQTLDNPYCPKVDWSKVPLSQPK